MSKKTPSAAPAASQKQVQSSMSDFFGGSSRPKKQKTMTSFFGKSKEEKEDTVVQTKDQNEEKPATAVAEKLRHKKRRVIEDDDSSDEEEVINKKVADTPVKKKRENDDTEETTTKSNTVTPPSAATAGKKKTVKKDSPAPKKKKSIEKEKEEDISEDESNNEKDEGVNDATKQLRLASKKLAKQAKVAWPPAGEKLTFGAGASEGSSSDKPAVLYQEVVKVMEEIEGITGRLDIQALCTQLFRKVLQDCPHDIYTIIYLCSNSVAPAYECVELGIGDSILIKAIAEAYGTKPATVKQNYEKEGDLGNVAKSYKSKQRTLGFGIKPKPLTGQRVLQTFREIAAISGSSSQKLKVDKIKKMLVAVQESTETKYIIRGLQGKLRIGLAETTVLIALAHALSFTIPQTVKVTLEEESNTEEDKESNDDDDEESKTTEDVNATTFVDASAPVEKRLEAAVNIVKQVYSEVPSYDALLDAALKVPLHKLHDSCSFQPGIPVAPMLAKPTKSIQEVLKRLDGESFTCEYKYDGERAQIHKTPDGKLKVFSRSLLDTSVKYPEVPLFVEEAATDSVTSFVMDAEVVAYNPKTDQLVPFQILSTRKKTEDSAESAKVQVIVQAFDLMFLNGKSLLNTKLEERRRLMKSHFLPVEGKFQYAKSLDSVENGDTTALEQFLDAAVKGQCEGLMVKTMNDVYEPSRRSLNWLKLKKDYLEGLGDSVDLVPLGAYFGRGKRTGVYGAYLLACYDEESEEFQSVCKIGTGFSDEDLKTLSATLNEHKIDAKHSQYNVADGLECDVWFDAVHVWEVKAADLSKSSLHRGCLDKLGEEGRGIGLRFPRFERVREDKKPEMATNSEQILDMYYNQDSVKGQEGNGGPDAMDEGI